MRGVTAAWKPRERSRVARAIMSNESLPLALGLGSLPTANITVRGGAVEHAVRPPIATARGGLAPRGVTPNVAGFPA